MASSVIFFLHMMDPPSEGNISEEVTTLSLCQELMSLFV